MKYRENMTADELAKFKQEVDELDAAYKSAAKHGEQVMASSTEEQEDPSDYVGMGWVDSRGRP
jgi:hypothetical protein